ncbi:MAG: ribose 5-phosphate isomerase B [Myxococcota bacterium]
MNILIASDHAGVQLKALLCQQLQPHHHIIDLGPDDHQTAVDYPDYAVALAKQLQQGKAQRGILLCGSGIGMCIAANKCSGIRAGLCHDTYSAQQGVQHDNMNVLVLGARVIGPALACCIAQAFLQTQFSGEARHVRRLNKVDALESACPTEK